jgi:hypothetical protein
MKAFIIMLLRAICKKEIFIIVLFQMIFFYPIGITLAQAPDTLWIKTFTGYLSGFESIGNNAVQQTTDGGYIITGTTDVSVSQEVLLIKSNEKGETHWTKTFGNGSGHSVQQTSDGGYALFNQVGYLGGTLLIKADSTGDTLWTKLLPDACNSARQTADGGYIITAGPYCFPVCYDFIVIRTNSHGDTLWKKIVGINGSSFSAQQTSDGGYIIAGRYPDLVKMDTNGNILWTKNIGVFPENQPRYVQQTSDGGYIIAGNTWKGNLNFDILLVKTDANGNNVWVKTFGGNLSDFATSVQQTSDGGYVLVGTINQDYSSGEVSNLVVIKTDSNGNSLWTKTFEGGWGNSIQQTSDGGYIVAGQNHSSNNPGIWLIRLAPDVTAVDENPNPIAKDYRLYQNYPNPFNPSTVIEFSLPEDVGNVQLSIYNMLGEKVAELVNTSLQAGRYQYQWNAQTVATGMYIYELRTDNFVSVKKMVLLK